MSRPSFTVNAQDRYLSGSIVSKQTGDIVRTTRLKQKVHWLDMFFHPSTLLCAPGAAVLGTCEAQTFGKASLC